ncbi:MAG: SHOCT domain-containing protein [Acidiferrobacterales bacterium]
MKYCIRFAFVVLSMVVTAAAHAQGYPGGGHMWGDWGWGHMIFGSLMMVLFWGGVIVVIVLLVRWLGSGSTGAVPPPTGKTALDILKERFACGEIDKEEFEERRRLLSD